MAGTTTVDKSQKPQAPKDPAEQYYTYLKGAGADVPPSFQSFKNTLASEKDSKQYFDYLKKNKFDAPDTYDSFINTLGVKKKESSDSSESPSASTPEQTQINPSVGSSVSRSILPVPNLHGAVFQDNKFLKAPSSEDVSDEKESLLSTAVSGLEQKSKQKGLTKEQQRQYAEQSHLLKTEFSKNFFDGKLTGADIAAVKSGMPNTNDWTGTDEELANLVNNKTRNIHQWSQNAINQTAKGYHDQLGLINKAISLKSAPNPTLGQQLNPNQDLRDVQLLNAQNDLQLASLLKDPNLEEKRNHLQAQISKIYNNRADKYTGDIVTDIQGMFTGASWDQILENPDQHYGTKDTKAAEAAGFPKAASPIRYDPKTQQLTPGSVKWVLDQVDKRMNSANDEVINYQTSGNNEQRARNYPDIARRVVQTLNTEIPIQHKQNEFRQSFKKDNPEIAKFIDSQEAIHNYFSPANSKSATAYVNTYQDQEFVKITDKYWGNNGQVLKSEAARNIQEKYAQMVHNGTMSEDVAKKNIMNEMKNNPGIKQILDREEKEKDGVRKRGRELYADYLTKGLQKIDPDVVLNTDGSVGVKGMDKNKFEKLSTQYADGLNKAAEEVLARQGAGIKGRADEKAKGLGAFWGSFGQSNADMMGAFHKWAFDKTGWGGSDTRMYQAGKMSGTGADQSEVIKNWNWQGWKSLANPDFYLSKVGGMVPVMAPTAAVGLATRGEALPEWISWLSSAGVFAFQNSTSTYNDLATSGIDKLGNKLTEYDAAQTMAKQYRDEILPDLAFAYLTSGMASRAKNIVKPTFVRQLGRTALGSVEGAIPMTWQGYLSYANLQEAQGKKASIFDYAQDDHMLTGLVDGIIGGFGLGLAHLPTNYMKSAANWKALIHSSEGEFRDNSLYHMAMQNEMQGMGEYHRDAMKMQLVNDDFSSPKEKEDVTRALLYSKALAENMKGANLDPKNTNDLYQAHNLGMADMNDKLAEQNKENKNLSKLYQDKAKDFREAASKISDGTGTYHYLVDNSDNPIFLSDKGFKVLDQEGKINEWLKGGRIKDVVKSDDPSFGTRYKEYMGVKEESNVEGKDIMDHGKDLIEQNKDKLGVYYQVAKDNPEPFYKEVADQVFGRNADGSISKRPDAEVESRTQYGDDIVDLAKMMHPETEESKLKAELSETVDPVLSRINNAEYINEKELDKVSDHLYDILDQNEKRGDLTDEQKQSVSNLIEPLITKIEGYDFRTKTETSTVTEKIPTQTVRETSKREIKTALERSAGSQASITGPDGTERQGILSIKDGNYVLDTPGEEPLVIGEKAINDRDLKLPSEERMEDPIQFDKDGNVKSVTFETRDGNLITINDPDKALDLAIQLRADAVGEVSIDQFDTVWNEVQKEISQEVPVKDISSPKTETDGKTEKTNEAEGRQEGDVLEKEKETEETKESTPQEPPPPSPPKETRVPKESPKEEFTAVRKEKNAEIKGAKELFDRQKRIKWTETYDNALKNVQGMYPAANNLYDAMKSRINEFVTKLDNGVLFNPTSEDISVFSVFKNETRLRMLEIQGLDSSDRLQGMSAAAEFKLLENDLFNIARVTNPGGEAGRAFVALQSEVFQDPEDGLKLRRMEYSADRAGKRLTPEELEWTAAQWDKEQDLTAKIEKATTLKMKEAFEKKLSDVRESYEKRLKAAKEDKKPAGDKEKREKLLKEKGADLAAKIRSGKLKGTYATFPGLPQAINLVIEGIAKLVEGGYTLAGAIDQYVKDNKIKNKDQFQNDLFEVFNKQEKQGDTLDKIRKMAEADGLTDVNKEMAGRNLIKDYMDAHVGLHDPKDVLDIVHVELKKILPDLEKDRLVEAYLKQGDFKQATKKELESGFKESQKNFERLVKLEKDINDLTDKKELYKKSNNKSSTPYDKEVEAKEKEKKAIMDSMGVKTFGEDKYKKASYDQRAATHNDRLDSIGNDIQNKIEKGGLSDKTEKSLIKLKNQLDAAKITIDPSSALSQQKTLDGGISLLKSIKSEFDRTTVDDISKVGEIRRSLQKSLDKFNSDKEDSEQDVKLQRAKDKAKRDADGYFQKISNGQYDDRPQMPLTKTDAELIKLERDRDAIGKVYQDRRRDYEKKNKGAFKRVAEFARAAMVDWMIGSPFTLLKVGASAVLRPNLEAATKITFGKGFEALPFTTTKAISERAKAGGESESIKSIQKGYQTYLRQYSPEQLENLYAKSNDSYEKADKEYVQQESEVYRVKYANGLDSPEYKEAADKLIDLNGKRNDALIDAIGNSVYQYIGGSSVKEGLGVLLHRSTQMERQFGDFDKEAWEKFSKSASGKEKIATAMDNVGYVMNFVGRSHAALKNFSARFSFGTGFIARLEYAVKNGEDISQPARLLELAHESYLDWERGKYQEKNWITDSWNKVTNAVEKIGHEGSKFRVFGEGMAYLMRADVAITRVPVNMLREGILEYTLGAFTGSIMAAREYYKAKGIVLQDGYTPESAAQFKNELKEQLEKIDPNKAATIVRAFRKGGFGLGLYALALLGHAAFGGWAHKGQSAEDKKKRLREQQTGVPELKTGEIEIGDYILPEWASKVVEHTPAFAPLGFGLGLAKVYGNNITDGKTTISSATNSAMAQINHIAGSIPMLDKVILPLASGAVQNVIKPGQWDDVDQSGNPMKREVFNVADHFKYLSLGTLLGNDIHLGDKKDILSEYYYKQATRTQKQYRDQITEVEINTSIPKEEKEKERERLLNELNQQIEDIYAQNKENPQ